MLKTLPELGYGARLMLTAEGIAQLPRSSLFGTFRGYVHSPDGVLRISVQPDGVKHANTYGVGCWRLLYHG